MLNRLEKVRCPKEEVKNVVVLGRRIQKCAWFHYVSSVCYAVEFRHSRVYKIQTHIYTQQQSICTSLVAQLTERLFFFCFRAAETWCKLATYRLVLRSSFGLAFYMNSISSAAASNESWWKEKKLSQERKSECVRCKPVKNAQLRRRSTANNNHQVR